MHVQTFTFTKLSGEVTITSLKLTTLGDHSDVHANNIITISQWQNSPSHKYIVGFFILQNLSSEFSSSEIAILLSASFYNEPQFKFK